VLGEQCLADLEHLVGGREGEAWGHGVEESSSPMKAANQRGAVAIGVSRSLVQLLPQEPIRDDETADDAQS
jgi:hypothetical protein